VDDLQAGWYEALVTEGLAEASESFDNDLVAARRLGTPEDRDRRAHHPAAFWFQGPGQHRGNRSREPMATRWEVDHPLPVDRSAMCAAAVA